MNESNRTPLLNAKTGKTGGTYIMKKGGDSSPPAAQAQGRQFANKYQKNAALMQKTFDLAQAAHPVACIVTILFKALAIFWYNINRTTQSSKGFHLQLSLPQYHCQSSAFIYFSSCILCN